MPITQLKYAFLGPLWGSSKEEYIKRVPVRFIYADKLKLLKLGLESSFSYSQSVWTSNWLVQHETVACNAIGQLTSVLKLSAVTIIFDLKYDKCD